MPTGWPGSDGPGTGPVLVHAADGFRPYGASHMGAVAVLLAVAVALVVAGRTLRVRDPDDRVGRALAIVSMTAVVPLQILGFTPEYWSLQHTLPIQLCDIGSIVAAYALWTHRRWAVALTYYWGLTLTTQAIATPDLGTPFPKPLFFLYWVMHMSTVWAAVHLTWGRRLWPDWWSYRTAVFTTAGWAVCIMAFNAAVDTNYGYLSRKPNSASILDVLGPWPWYVVAESAIIAVAWALLTWPWVVHARSRPGREPYVGTVGTPS